MNSDDSIYVAGHTGLVGSAVTRRLRAAGFTNLLLVTRAEADLTRQADVERLFQASRPRYVLLCAAKVGGIFANDSYPADFIRDNLQIQTNIIDAAYRHGVSKLLFLGSSCIYPKSAPQPLREEYLLSGPLEPTNEWYAIAKIAGIKMCQAYARQHGMRAICAMPTNLYGPGDNFNIQNAHVLPALIRKFHAARIADERQVVVWGSGTPRREFLHVDDLADAVLHLMLSYESPEPINVGVGEDIPIIDLARLIAHVVGFEGDIRLDSSKPDGVARKVLEVSRLRSLGWHARISLEDGIRTTYEWFVRNAAGRRD